MGSMVIVSAILILLCATTLTTGNDACCSYPCQHGGVCMTEGYHDYTCDCVGTGFNGHYCELPSTWSQSVQYWLRPTPETLHYLLTNFKWVWDVVNAVPFLQKTIMRIVYIMRGKMVDSPPLYESDHSYTTMDANSNSSYYMRALPPVPTNCPTPMGVVGKKELPSPDVLVEEFFRRRKFQPEDHGSNLLFTFFAQHFTHIFFKTDLKKGPGFTWGGHGVDGSHIYGPHKASENLLRSFKDGKLKTQVLRGEEWPPRLRDAPVKMLYPPRVPEEKQFAIGHEFYGLLPGLFVYATIWVREHNRVCDVLRGEHPEWDDERTFQTAKLIIIGETIKIVIEDYVQHLSRYNLRVTFDPELLFGQSYQYQNRIAVEFNHLYHWHPLMPDNYHIGGVTYPIQDFIYNNDIVIDHGLETVVDSLRRQVAGKVTSQNHANFTLHVAKQTIEHGRALRLQPLNAYRRHFRLAPYASFTELTGETELAGKLEELYGDIEAVEFYIGVMVEKHRPDAMFGGTIVEVGGPFSVKGLMSNPICSPKYWRPSTFGGNVGFDIVKTASLKKLFSQNLKKSCHPVSFSIVEMDSTEVVNLHNYQSEVKQSKEEL